MTGGGPNCDHCGDGKGCAIDLDCVSKSCGVYKRCTSAADAAAAQAKRAAADAATAAAQARAQDEEGLAKKDEHLTNAVTAVSLVYGALVAMLLARLTQLRFGAALGRACHALLCCCTDAGATTTAAGTKGGSQRRLSAEAEPEGYVGRLTASRLALLVVAAGDFVTDLWALTEFDDTHRRWGVACMWIAAAANTLAMVLGFFRPARRDALLDAALVRKHVREHALVVCASATNLDNLNLLAWRDGRFNGFPRKSMAWLTVLTVLVENVPQVAILVSNAKVNNELPMIMLASVAVSGFAIVLKVSKMAFLTLFSGMDDWTESSKAVRGWFFGGPRGPADEGDAAPERRGGDKAAVEVPAHSATDAARGRRAARRAAHAARARARARAAQAAQAARGMARASSSGTEGSGTSLGKAPSAAIEGASTSRLARAGNTAMGIAGVMAAAVGTVLLGEGGDVLVGSAAATAAHTAAGAAATGGDETTSMRRRSLTSRPKDSPPLVKKRPIRGYTTHDGGGKRGSAPLPKSWKKVYSVQHRRAFYQNTKDGSTMWTLPTSKIGNAEGAKAEAKKAEVSAAEIELLTVV